ncbi:hypothetical protein GOP47_0023213 [Adiantum capillus-veneris]|uniref:Uncharacterized protein n=1 Tax=Adiantum capillus-veneris TaxID=13818 RepID=A0A9D4U6X2_ADICA|nr:hypothetical protein GOP47_0023213 [Adiantum capillus-veneris]
MARWLIELAALHKYAPVASTYISSSYLAIAVGLVVSLCCVIVILSMCSFCDVIRRERVGDKASSSDGDASPAVTARQAFFASMTAKKSTMLGAQRLPKEEGSKVAAADHHQLLEQGKLSPNVWQRAILMGERCKRPNFSGLILYDEKGNPLPRRFPK